MFKEALDQLDGNKNRDIVIFLQAGVGTFASSAIEFFLHYQDCFERLRFCIVEPKAASCIYESAVEGRIMNIKVGSTQAGCLACGEPNPIEIDNILENAKYFLRIDDDLIEQGISVFKKNNIDTSYNGAITFSAFLNLGDLMKSDVDANTTCLFFNTERNLK